MIKPLITRMTTFMKAKLEISDDQTNIDKYRVAANNIEYHIITYLIFLSIVILKFKIIRQLFHIKINVEMLKSTFWSQL